MTQLKRTPAHRRRRSDPDFERLPPAPVLTIPGAAAQLGCSEMHIYRLIAAKELRAVDISVPGTSRSKTRIRADYIADYIDRQTRTA